MVNWQDQYVIDICTSAFIDLYLFVLGLYGWYYLHSLQVETALLRRQLSFRWPMASYIVGRIVLLAALIISAIVNAPLTLHIDCAVTLKFLAYSNSVVVACASTNLVALTWAVWKPHRSVCLLLVLTTLGHWFISTFNSWGSQISSFPRKCGVLALNPMYSGVASTYATIFDFFLLKLTILGHWQSSPAFSLWASFHKQGIIYFFIVFLASVIPLVFSWLNLNYIMDIIFALPASCVMTIASSYALSATMIPPRVSHNRTPAIALPERKKENVQVTIARSSAVAEV